MTRNGSVLGRETEDVNDHYTFHEVGGSCRPLALRLPFPLKVPHALHYITPLAPARALKKKYNCHLPIILLSSSPPTVLRRRIFVSPSYVPRPLVMIVTPRNTRVCFPSHPFSNLGV